MLIKEIKDALNCRILTGQQYLNKSVTVAYTSDLMADVLAHHTAGCILVTGLINLQSIRTAQIQDIPVIIFTRGKIPDKAMIELAESYELCILCTEHSSFAVSGILYEGGVREIE